MTIELLLESPDRMMKNTMVIWNFLLVNLFPVDAIACLKDFGSGAL